MKLRDKRTGDWQEFAVIALVVDPAPMEEIPDGEGIETILLEYNSIHDLIENWEDIDE